MYSFFNTDLPHGMMFHNDDDDWDVQQKQYNVHAYLPESFPLSLSLSALHLLSFLSQKNSEER